MHDKDHQGAVAALLDEIRREVRQCAPLTGLPALPEPVMAALQAVPRGRFVDPELQDEAWENHPLPIGYRQTISQPFIVALMTALIEPGANDVVLEIGTGSGYQAAVLARLVRRVESVEVIEPLARSAAQVLASLGCDNVATHLGDGRLGRPAGAPYDAIIVTAASPDVPPALIAQLRPGGRLVIPLGSPHGRQDLTLLRKGADGQVSRRAVLPVAFVPLTQG